VKRFAFERLSACEDRKHDAAETSSKYILTYRNHKFNGYGKRTKNS